MPVSAHRGYQRNITLLWWPHCWQKNKKRPRSGSSAERELFGIRWTLSIWCVEVLPDTPGFWELGTHVRWGVSTLWFMGLAAWSCSSSPLKHGWYLWACSIGTLWQLLYVISTFEECLSQALWTAFLTEETDNNSADSTPHGRRFTGFVLVRHDSASLQMETQTVSGPLTCISSSPFIYPFPGMGVGRRCGGGGNKGQDGMGAFSDWRQKATCFFPSYPKQWVLDNCFNVEVWFCN